MVRQSKKSSNSKKEQKQKRKSNRSKKDENAPRGLESLEQRLMMSASPLGDDASIVQDEPTSAAIEAAAQSVEQTANIVVSATDTWSSGFTGSLTLTNNSAEAWDSWRVEFETPHDISSAWNAQFENLGEGRYAISNPSWASALASGDSVEIGFSANSAYDGQGATITNVETTAGTGETPDTGTGTPTTPGGTPGETVGEGAPAIANINITDERPSDGEFTVSFAKYSGAAATSWELLENGEVVASGDFDTLGTTQTGSVDITGHDYGVYEYQVRLINDEGSSISASSAKATNGASFITIDEVDAGDQALQLTVEQGQTVFALDDLRSENESFVAYTNNGSVLDVAINADGDLVVSGLDAGRGSVRIVNTETGEERFVGVRVLTDEGEVPGRPDYLAIGSVSEDSAADIGFWQDFGDGEEGTNKRVDSRYIYLNGGPENGWRSWQDGQRLQSYLRESLKLGITPQFVYYNIPDGGESYYTNNEHLNSEEYMRGYFEDLQFALETIEEIAGDEKVELIFEPDFIGYLMQLGQVPADQVFAFTDQVYEVGLLERGVDPNFDNTVTGLIQAINYSVSNADANIDFGWQFNLWASPGINVGIPSTGLIRITDSLGLDAGREAIVAEAQEIANYYLNAGVTSYGADFISIDKYGLDAVGYQAGAAADPESGTWFWNQDHWDNYLLFTKTLHETTERPVTLWQIPVGRINGSESVNPYTGEAFEDLPNTTARYEDSAGTYFFGDTFTGDQNRVDYFGENLDGNDGVTVDGNSITWEAAWEKVADAGVTQVLFGAGVGISTDGVGSPPTDGYWFISKVQEYYDNPVELDGEYAETVPDAGSGVVTPPDSGTGETPDTGTGETPDSGQEVTPNAALAVAIDSAWSNGFSANVTITNPTDAAVDTWTVEFSVPDGVDITSLWNGNLEDLGDNRFRITDLGWNGSLEAGASTEVGFVGAGAVGSATQLAVSNVTFNGVPVGVPTTTPGETETPDTGTGETPDTGTGETPDTGVGETPDTGTGETPDTGVGETPDTGTGETPDTGVGETPDTGTGETPDTGVGETPDTGTGETPDTGVGEEVNPAVALTVDSAWSNGFNASLTVTNTTDGPIDSWTVDFTLPDGIAISSLWNGVLEDLGDNRFRVSNVDWNGSLGVGSSLTIGFGGTGDPSNLQIADVEFNGTAAVVTNPETNPGTTPGAGETPDAGVTDPIAALPSATIEGVSVTDSHDGQKQVMVTVSIDEPSDEAVTIEYRTQDRSAVAGEDYVATSGVVTIEPGETTASIAVGIIGDNIEEYNERFDVVLHTAENAKLSIARAGVVIVGENGEKPAGIGEDDYRVVGYFPEWAVYQRDYHIADVPADNLTHLIYAFADVTASGDVTLFDSYAAVEKSYPGDVWDQELRGNFNQMNQLKAENPHLKTMIALGGWTLSAHFSDVVSTEAGREILAENAVQFMLQYGFDGIDIDWEFPGGGGLEGNSSSPNDRENFTLFIQELRAQLDTQSQVDGNEYELSVAISAGYDKFAHVELEAVSQSIDFYNMLTYDFHGRWDATQTGHLSGLYNSDSNTNLDPRYNADSAIQEFLAAGVDSKKIVLGAPLYGFGWTGVSDVNNGLHQAAAGLAPGGIEEGYYEFRDVYELVKNNPDSYQFYYDESAQATYVYAKNIAGGTFITIEDARSMQAKIDYVQEYNLGGMMFWEISNDLRETDHPDSLVLQVADQLLRGVTV
ncbi:Chitinase A1 precursor [Poriferisphaera corsica]|uniref:chitinase n=1 Tax=Poriferisphaera corsica TaxID=2528020 RepID=A0A517YSS6_9BACT|nr:glycosyl hydrolase family 18 protein [Poriferisphaera corsica]QDU33289.1 Chitinase A1 precursor [Poriferisphaera corsica]